MEVIATQVGYVDHIRRKEGEKFNVPDDSMSSWYEPTDDKIVDEYRKRRDAAYSKAMNTAADKSAGQVKDLQKIVDEKNAEIAGLQAKAAEKDGVIAELQKTINELEEDSADPEAQKTIEGLQFELAEANAKIKKLEKK